MPAAAGTGRPVESAGTGRLVDPVGLRTRRIVYGDLGPADLAAELDYSVEVDRAHVVMLAEQALVPADAAAALLRCIDELASAGFGPLAGRPAPRGVYLMYEGYLIERLGAGVGGLLQLGRSRNDLKAAVTALRTRTGLIEVATEAARLEAVLLSRARAYRSVLMPMYTHFQAALPVSLGWYLLGVARAVGRDVDAVLAAADPLQVCPLGAGPGGGTDLPIDPLRTARLLGFRTTTVHALDAVASRDGQLRLIGAIAGLAVTISRLATDLQLWSTAEFGLIDFPDRLVGGSSAMPQKRNAFLLEHVKAKAGLAIGAWTAMAAAMAGTPFTNSIEVGTEAVGALAPGQRAALDAIRLSQTLVSAVRPNTERMRERVVGGYTTATAIANRLARRGMPFRSAHSLVGAAVRQAVAAGDPDVAGYGPAGWLDGIERLDPEQVMHSQRHGGGPGAFDSAFDPAVLTWQAHRDGLARWRAELSAAAAELVTAVGDHSAGDGGLG